MKEKKFIYACINEKIQMGPLMNAHCTPSFLQIIGVETHKNIENRTAVKNPTKGGIISEDTGRFRLLQKIYSKSLS